MKGKSLFFSLELSVNTLQIIFPTSSIFVSKLDQYLILCTNKD